MEHGRRFVWVRRKAGALVACSHLCSLGKKAAMQQTPNPLISWGQGAEHLGLEAPPYHRGARRASAFLNRAFTGGSQPAPSKAKGYRIKALAGTDFPPL